MGTTDTIGYMLQHTASIMYRQSDQVLQERLGLGMSQYKILMILHEKPQIRQRVLADQLGQTEASISRQIKLLVERGMLVVEINPKNRREHLTRPTARGVKVTQAAQEVLEEYHSPVFGQFNEKEQQTLNELLHRVHVEVCGPRKPITCDKAFDL
jgi:DNA-binding MarR family transcriptional regulator